MKNSSRTPSDKVSLVPEWDSSHIDTDFDGQKVGDVDFIGQTWTVENLPAGTWIVVLTVTDDNGDPPKLSSPFWSLKPHQTRFSKASRTPVVGTTTAMVIGVLGIIIVNSDLLLFTRRPGMDEDFGKYNQSAFATQSVATQVAATPVQSAVPSSAPTVSMPDMDAQPANTGPPLPATGLPAGWTMEQWTIGKNSGWQRINPLQHRFNP